MFAIFYLLSLQCLFERLFLSPMDANEIDLDDLDKSDISSDWDSSVDEAPVMEVVESRGEQEVQEERMIAEEQLREMQSDEEPDSIPRSF